ASAGERREAYVALGELAAATGATRALIDVSAMRATYATMVSYDHAVRLVASLPHGVRLAVLLSADPAQLGAAAFVRDVANNRGLTLELFATLEAALAWLEGREATTGVARAVV
ncbi:MAG: hypothetical protein RLW62_00105, partial [Gammaproteobacteria bacterium]